MQHFKMGLFTRDMRAMRAVIARASALCEVQVLDYDQSEKVMDNTVFTCPLSRSWPSATT